ncbi:MAG TPA: hypothetical protein DEB09_00490 [Candidatus Magasanikbacteria bacterium]|nr:hypothetical protein [Candidatus Magasanikbacteria bacterium]
MREKKLSNNIIKSPNLAIFVIINLFIFNKLIYMTTLNEAYKIVKKLELLTSPSKDYDLLGIQESITKLWIASWKKDKDEVGKRLANLLIGTFVIAKRLGINDVEYYFDKRMVEFKKELETGSCWEKKGKSKKKTKKINLC